jgi:Protein of unknown function (DUF3631)
MAIEQRRDEFKPTLPPVIPQRTDIRHGRLGVPSFAWPYFEQSGEFSGIVCRFEVDIDGKRDKTFRPYRYGELNGAGVRWCWKGWGDGRPLYNLPELASHQDAEVLVTEGEKACDGARKLFTDCVAVSPMNGAQSPHKTDWAPLAGCNIVIWPDNDDPGRKFAGKIVKLVREAGAATLAVVRVPEAFPEGWDLADEPPPGVGGEFLAALLASAGPWTDEPEPPQTPVSEQEVKAAVRRLADLSSARYEIERKVTAKHLGIELRRLDRLVKGERENGGDEGDCLSGQGSPVEIADVEPWPEPVSGSAVLDGISKAVRDYVVVTARQADAIALWAVWTHAFDACDFSPKLDAESPEKRSGKTRLAEVLERLVARPLFISGISPSALFRIVERHRPTLLLDEMDVTMKANAEIPEVMRGLINSGFARRGARVIRNVPVPGGGYEPRAFSTWCPMFIAGIGKRPDTVVDRSVTIPMKRKKPDEKVNRLRERDGLELWELGRKAARWAADDIKAIEEVDPEPVQGLNDRAADAWSPLFAVAEVAGGEWPKRARHAALELSGGSEAAETAREMLLADLREMFEEDVSDVLFTKEILPALQERDDRPWPEWKNGRPITSRQLAALLKPLGIKGDKTVRRGPDTAKGYKREHFEDAFSRYLPPLPPSQSVTPSQPAESLGVSGNSIRHRETRCDGSKNVKNPGFLRVVTDVTNSKAPHGGLERDGIRFPRIRHDRSNLNIRLW